MSAHDKILNRFQDATNLKVEFENISFHTHVGKKEFQIEIVKNGVDYQAQLTDLDSGYSQTVPCRTENSLDDLLHELRIYLAEFRN